MARRSWDESDVRVRANKRGSRPRTKQRPAHEDAVTARVVAVDRGRYTYVLNEDSAEPVTVLCVRAKELRRRPIVPGDRVGVVGDVTGAPDTLARIVRIEERTTVAPGSLVMRQETVPSDGNWGGNPIRHLEPGDQVVSAQVVPTPAAATRRGAHAATERDVITQHGAGSTVAPATAVLPTAQRVAQHEGATE